MEKPFLDFAFSLGKLDVMSIGPGDANIGAAVSNVIKGILDTMMVFPNKMVVPILLEQDMLVREGVKDVDFLCMFCLVLSVSGRRSRVNPVSLV